MVKSLFPIVILLLSLLAASAKPYTTWQDYAGGTDSMQYSALSQINRTNVGRLELAWSYTVPDRRGTFGFNPLIVDNVMFVLGRSNSVVALDAVTGHKIWVHQFGESGMPGNRGFNYWESKDRSDRRLIFTLGGLRALNAKTGAPITTFGNNGFVDLRTPSPGNPRALGGPSSSPGRVFENLLIIGSNTGEESFSPPGDIRAYDIVTGKLAWTFRTIPIPGDYGHDTWPSNAWKYVGGANCWGEISVDAKRGIAYVPLGAPTHDVYGGDRKGANLFGNCLVALDARTGKRLWHFQAVHHDLWDYDLVNGPKLLTVRHQGKPVDVVAQATKVGFVYVFNRVTGEPLWPVEERPVPQSTVPGEVTWPTQPFPTKPPPFARHEFRVEDINPYLPEAERERIRERLQKSRNEGLFAPPTLDQERVAMPGEWGGSNWGGCAADPETGMLYVRTADQPTISRLKPQDPWTPDAPSDVRGSLEERGRMVYSRACVFCHGEPEGHALRTMDKSALIRLNELGNDRLTNVIRQGQAQMPAFPPAALSEETLRALLAYLADPAAVPATHDPSSQWKFPIDPIAAREGEAFYSGPRYTAALGNVWRAANGQPAIGPPWSEIVAYDLNQGTIKWRAPLGTVPSLAAKGITNTGNARRIHRNGLAVTGGGLIFAGCSGDRTMRAFDKDTGKTLWEFPLETNPEGIPAVYEVRGRQYVVVCAWGTARDDEQVNPDTRPGKASAQGYYVFALPEKAAGK